MLLCWTVTKGSKEVSTKRRSFKDSWLLIAQCSMHITRILHHFNLLTHPQVVHFLAHAAVLFWDLIKVLIEAWLQWDEAWQWGEVGF